MATLPAGYKECTLGRTTLVLPPDHRLDQYQRVWPRIQLALGDLARLIPRKYSGFHAVDIGANVGDTAAVICNESDVPTLCIEGNPAYWPYLEENARRMGPHIVIDRSFIGAVEETKPLAIYTDPAGTAKLVPALDGSEIMLRTLDRILRDHPRFISSKLIKIDIDGFDFEVILGAADLLKALQPVLFYEYAPIETETGARDGIACFKMLAEIGYSRFLIWDGFGHYMVHLTAADFDKFVDLTFFLVSNRRFGPAIYHYDICAFPSGDTDLFEALRQHQLGLCLQPPDAQP
jgi:FkbM family methyltransferase